MRPLSSNSVILYLTTECQKIIREWRLFLMSLNSYPFTRYREVNLRRLNTPSTTDKYQLHKDDDFKRYVDVTITKPSDKQPICCYTCGKQKDYGFRGVVAIICENCYKFVLFDKNLGEYERIFNLQMFNKGVTDGIRHSAVKKEKFLQFSQKRFDFMRNMVNLYSQNKYVYKRPKQINFMHLFGRVFHRNPFRTVTDAKPGVLRLPYCANADNTIIPSKLLYAIEKYYDKKKNNNNAEIIVIIKDKPDITDVTFNTNVNDVVNKLMELWIYGNCPYECLFFTSNNVQKENILHAANLEFEFYKIQMQHLGEIIASVWPVRDQTPILIVCQFLISDPPNHVKIQYNVVNNPRFNNIAFSDTFGYYWSCIKCINFQIKCLYNTRIGDFLQHTACE